MGRFEREDIEAKRLPAKLGTATEDLRSTVESELARIVERAEARAAEIEDQALEKASRIEQQSERRAQDLFQDARERVGEMLAQIDALEHAVGEAVRSLRVEAERLTGEIDSVQAEPLEQAEPHGQTQPPEQTEPPEQTDATETEPTGDSEPDVSEPNSAAPAPIADPEVREMIREQLLSLAENGRGRADAERMLLRFRQGTQYLDLLDEIYPEEPVRRQGLLRRRKA